MFISLLPLSLMTQRNESNGKKLLLMQMLEACLTFKPPMLNMQAVSTCYDFIWSESHQKDLEKERT